MTLRSFTQLYPNSAQSWNIDAVDGKAEQWLLSADEDILAKVDVGFIVMVVVVGSLVREVVTSPSSVP